VIIKYRLPLLVVTALAGGLALFAAAACAESDPPAAEPTPEVLVGAGEGEQQTPEPVPDESEATTPPPDPTHEPSLVSLDWLASDLTLPGLAGGVAAPAVDGALQAVIQDEMRDFGGGWSVVVHNLADGRYATANEGAVWYAASTFKAAVLLEAYRQRDSGELDFAELVELTAEYTQYDLGTLEYLELATGDLVSIGDAVKGMIVVSDTSLATLVTEQVTGNRVDETLREIGATVRTVNDYELPTTALDLAQVMIAIAAGHGVAQSSRDEMLSLLAQEWFRDGIIAGVPDGTNVAHKSGRYTGATHDAAIVWGPAGPYVIVVMTDGSGGSGGWAPIARVSEAAWRHFEGS
jgi:beta-lactamase class A